MDILILYLFGLMLGIPLLLWIIIGIGYAFSTVYRVFIRLIKGTFSVFRKAKEYEKLILRLTEIETKEKTIIKEEEKATSRVQKLQQDFERLLAEKTKGFPWLANAYAEYQHLEELKEAKHLANKKRPAFKAAEMVKASAARRREAECTAKILRYQIEYYENLFPWLTEFKSEEIAEELIRIEAHKEQGTESDSARLWLSKGEYMSLPPRKRYQLALERYWKRKKTRFEVGRDYERFIGWTYEKDGYSVYYQGIIKGFDDLGRDLIVENDKEVTVVQCKYWAKDKTIHEKHIFQLYGTMTSFQIENPSKQVRGRFVTSTKLSERARRFSDHLGILTSENTPLDEYPCIKCNISTGSGERIYHLPFDQQYDTTKIEAEKGEIYCKSVAEAEDLGFRRAMRYRGGAKFNT